MVAFVPWSVLSENDRYHCETYLINLFENNKLNGVEFVDALIDFYIKGVHFSFLDVARGIALAC